MIFFCDFIQLLNYSCVTFERLFDFSITMFDQLKESLGPLDGIRCDRLRRSLSSASLHINRNQIQQMYNSLPRPNMKNYLLPTISSKNKSMGSDGEQFLPPIDSDQGATKQKMIQEHVR